MLQEFDTMQYNAGYDIDVNDYNYETGTINKTNEELFLWYESWNNSDNKRYYAYICDKKSKTQLEKYFYYQEQENNFGMGIVISNKCRGKGYGYQALIELQRIAFEEYNVNALIDKIPENRLGAIKTFKKAGFIENGTEDGIQFEKKINCVRLIITKEKYQNNKVYNYDNVADK